MDQPGSQRAERSKAVLEKTAMGLACVVVAVGVWFWSAQIMDVIEMLRLAYG